MKKLINDPLNVVREMLEGDVALAPGQVLMADETVVLRSDIGPAGERPVAVISGGGSGHEPAHAGYVGRGMLTAAVAGDVFTSPSSDAVLAAIRAAAGPAGAILIVKNYTGDRLNFGLAAELARAEGIPVEVVVVADDVALRHTVEEGRRRGIGGTSLVHKLAGAGAAAGKGAGLADVASLARSAAGALGSMGVALGSCTLPAVGRPSFALEPDEIELGLGIHGEPGVERGKIVGAAALVERMLATILEDRDIVAGARVALLVNGLGATPPMELAIVTRDALRFLEKQDVTVERAWCGTFLSALDMPGFSLSILPVDDARLDFLDADANAPAWPAGGGGRLNRHPVSAEIERTVDAGADGRTNEGEALPIRIAAYAAAQALVDQEAALTDLDSRAGDGDLGSSMARGAAAVMALPASCWGHPRPRFQAWARRSGAPSAAVPARFTRRRSFAPPGRCPELTLRLPPTGQRLSSMQRLLSPSWAALRSAIDHGGCFATRRRCVRGCGQSWRTCGIGLGQGRGGRPCRARRDGRHAAKARPRQLPWRPRHGDS